jgi:signal transduction histidine kinase
MKFTTNGEIKITVTQSERDPNILQVSLSDTGKGIEKKNIDKLFQPYASLRDTNNQKGIGLGLYTCKQ